MTEKLAKEWSWENVPWWYTERALLSTFAAAVWNSGGVAFEEYSTSKRLIEKRNSKKQNIYTGRCDLYIKIGKREFILEAKHVWSPAGEKAHNPVSKIRYYLGEARKAVKRIKSDDGEERLAVVFAAPYIPTSQKTIIDDRINNWIAQIKKIKYSSAAWIFPPKARTPLPKERWIYPGVALVIKKIS